MINLIVCRQEALYYLLLPVQQQSEMTVLRKSKNDFFLLKEVGFYVVT